jgi:small subunit ribosomal protein S1
VTELKTDLTGRPYALLSRKNAQERCRREFIERLCPGDVIKARVTHLESFGVFCDIGCGIIALLPIDSVSVSRISHPRDRFSPGDDIKVVVKSIGEDGKITLSHKELLGTWQENADNFKAGQTVGGVIRSIEKYGVFIELSPNLAGLAEYTPDVKEGDLASVYIKSINPEKMKIKLSVVDSFPGNNQAETIKYYFDGVHMDNWQYSPENSEKNIQTIF